MRLRTRYHHDENTSPARGHHPPQARFRRGHLRRNTWAHTVGVEERGLASTLDSMQTAVDSGTGPHVGRFDVTLLGTDEDESRFGRCHPPSIPATSYPLRVPRRLRLVIQRSRTWQPVQRRTICLRMRAKMTRCQIWHPCRIPTDSHQHARRCAGSPNWELCWSWITNG